MHQNRRFSISVAIGLVLISMLACEQSGQIKPTATFTPSPTLTGIAKQATKPKGTGTVTVMAPTATTRPKTRDMEVMSGKSWYSASPDDPRKIGYVVNINNPDEQYQLEDVSYKITLVDNAGQALGTANETIMLLMPGEHKPLAGKITIPEGTQPVNIQVENISPGRPTIASDKKDPIQSSNLWYLVGGAPPATSLTLPKLVSYPSNHSLAASGQPVLTGVITSAYDQDIYYANYAVAAYDDQGAVVGGGSVFGEVLPSHSTIGVVVPLILTGKPASFELSFTGSGSTETTPPATLKLEVGGLGLVRNPDRMDAGAVFMLKNPDPKTPVARLAYILTVVNGDGMVVDVCHNTFYGVIFPGQQVPVGCSLQISPTVTEVKTEVVTLVDLSDVLPNTVTQNPLSVDRITFDDAKANAVIKSTWATELKEVQAQLVVFDASGALIGYGNYPSLTIPANGELPVEIWYSQMQGTPARVEIDAVPSQFSFEN